MAKQRTTSAKPKSDYDARMMSYAFWTAIWDRIFDLGKLMAWFGGTALVIFVAVPLPLYITAGKVTSVDFAYQAIADFRLDFVFPLAAAGTTTALWQRERKLRRDDTERLHKQIKLLETKLHPGRTSSGLTQRGDTPKDSS